MSKLLNYLWNFIAHYKYLIVIVLGVLFVGFLDDNSYLNRVKLRLQKSELESEIQRYREIHKANMEQLHELRRDPKAIEKIAREHYFMKADDEDIFVLSDDRRPEVAAEAADAPPATP